MAKKNINVHEYIEFEDNSLLVELYGQHDSNLMLIEEALEVQIVPKGNKVAFIGETEKVQFAKIILEDLYKLAEEGLDISKSRVADAIRVTTDNEEEIKMTEKNKQTKKTAKKTSKKSEEQRSGEERREEETTRPNDFIGKDEAIKTPYKVITPRSRHQHSYVKALKENTLTFGVGPAGTGKTYIATAYAVSLLLSKQVKKIILTRPVVEAGEALGFLPGTLEEKIDPYLRPFFDALNEMLGHEKTKELMDNQIVEIAPLAYMRGRTFNDAIMILDEAQNTTCMQIKMFLTRMGENGRMIVTGDLTQTDLKAHETSGLQDAIGKLEDVKDIGIIKFSHKDVVRHPLVAKIVKAYGDE